MELDSDRQIASSRAIRREHAACRTVGMTGFADYFALTKPRITALVVFTTASGLLLAGKESSAALWLCTVIGTALVVAAANVLNMYLERDVDARMPRTMRRPLPAGRIRPVDALVFGLALGVVSIALLAFTVGPLPATLATAALVTYVLIYTPMKQRSPAALLVGAVAGAAPPLIGWTAATGGLELPGLLLFAVMFLWQVPHFLAITLFRRKEYARAGLLVQANESGGDRRARLNIVLYTAAVVSASLLFVPLGVVRLPYLIVAVAGGALFLACGVKGLLGNADEHWARREFFLSLTYLTVVLLALLANRA
jgi:protoheme IX farnesyltransferase